MMKMKKIFTLIQIFLYTTLGNYVVAQNVPLSPKDTITDNHIVYPVDMEQNYDKLLSQWGKDLRYPSNCSVQNDDVVTLQDSAYINRLYALPTRMELVFNPVVKQYIEMYAGKRKQLVSYMLGQGAYYFPMFENVLDKEGLPLELKYLPVIESALNPIARSRVGATGLWQFMAGTGKLYNLEINSLVDDRRDPLKSTEAAVRYLKDMYSIYGDWNLVIAAYNCGPGNVNKAIRRSGGQTDYWAIYPYLPRETRGYVPAFIAATYIMNYYKDHNICPAVCNYPPAMDSVMINKNLHLQQVAEVLNIPIEDIRTYNPQFKNDIIPGTYKEYALNLPIDKITSFIDNNDTIYAHRMQELLTHRKVAGLDVVGPGSEKLQRIHRVKRGESLGSIANKYGVTVAQLQRWNGLGSKSMLSVGKKIIVSSKTITKQPEKELAQINTSEADVKENIIISAQPDNAKSVLTKTIKVSKPHTITTYYTIKKGDRLAKIADINGVQISQLKKWNNLKGDNIVAGKKIKIVKTEIVEIEQKIEYPQPMVLTITTDDSSLLAQWNDYKTQVEKEHISPLSKMIAVNLSQKNDHTEISENQIIYHKVRIGETIPQIAKHYNVSRKDIMTWNKLSSGIAKVGQRLLIYLPQKNIDNSMNAELNDSSTNETLASNKSISSQYKEK